MTTLLTSALKLYDSVNHDETTTERPKANYVPSKKMCIRKSQLVNAPESFREKSWKVASVVIM